MRFFDITFANKSQMAWAGGYGPISDLWFLHGTSLKRKLAFWDINPMAPGLHIDSGAKHWPDILGCGGSPPLLFVSGRVVASLRSIGAPMGRVTEMPIAEINAKALKSKPAPKYYVVETLPGIEVDLEATGFNLDAEGKAIVHPPPNPWPKHYCYCLNTWTGADLFAYRHFGPTDGPYTDMFCTERVKELAENQGWTNVQFESICVI